MGRTPDFYIGHPDSRTQTLMDEIGDLKDEIAHLRLALDVWADNQVSGCYRCRNKKPSAVQARRAEETFLHSLRRLSAVVSDLSDS